MADINVILLGSKSVGKSSIGNAILGLSTTSEDYFVVENDPNERNSFGSLLLTNNVGDRLFKIVDTPGFFDEHWKIKQTNWQDMAHAFDIIGSEVNVFLIVLDTNDPSLGQKMVESFSALFGQQAAVNTMVVFTSKSNRPTSRHLDVWHSGYLLQYLKMNVPFIFVEKADQGDGDLIKMIKRVASEEMYTKDHFLASQLEFAKNWIMNERKSNVRQKQQLPTTQSNPLKRFGVPEVLYDRFFTPEMIEDLLKINR